MVPVTILEYGHNLYCPDETRTFFTCLRKERFCKVMYIVYDRENGYGPHRTGLEYNHQAVFDDMEILYCDL
jgi:hypothetical protein